MRSSSPGLYYRNPAKGAIIFKDQNGKTLKRVDEVIAQLGFVNSLPVNAGPFESVTFKATFDVNGGLVTAGYTESAAPATGLASLSEAVATQYGVLRNYENGKDQTTQDAELKRLQTELAIKKAQERLTPAQPSDCLLYTSPSPRDRTRSRMPSSA